MAGRAVTHGCTARSAGEQPNPSTETIAQLLAQALDALDIAEGLENRRATSCAVSYASRRIPRILKVRQWGPCA